MKARPVSSLRKSILLLSLFFTAIFAFAALSLFTVRAQNGGSYFTANTVVRNGETFEQDIISGPPQPPAGYEVQRAAVDLLEPGNYSTAHTLTAPAYNWVFGCSSVSGAMILGYYDRNGFPNMYSGPTDGGVAPLDNSSWGTWSDGYTTYPNLPLAASHNGVDGRVTRGSIDDYWIQYNSTASDPYITGSWTQHTWSDAIGDYMKTSQSAFNNTDGSTRFYNYTSSSAALTCDYMVSNSITDDGTVGRRLFYQARGYTVTDCYNQKTDNNGGGFTYAMYKAEIDAGRPVMLNLAGHTIVGVGYDDASSTIYIHDTWDYLDHTMTWGGSYSGMNLLSVSIVNLQPAVTLPGAFNKSSPANGATGVATNPTLSWSASSGATSYEYCYGTSSNCSNWTSVGANTSVALSGLSGSQMYYWQVRAANSAGYTQANSNTYWSFTTVVTTPMSFSKRYPLNAAMQMPATLTLSWASSTGATSYLYCIDTVNNGTCDTGWASPDTNTSKHLSGLSQGMHYWQVRAHNGNGDTDANGGVWWSFKVVSSFDLYSPMILMPGTPPGSFAKTSPSNGASNQPVNPTISWGASSSATSYSYCIDTTDNSTCNTSWVGVSASTSAGLTSLAHSTTYYWQIRASNGYTTEANGGTWWSFTTLAGTDAWTTIMTENFEGSFPSGWTLSNTSGYDWAKRNCRAHGGSYSGWAVGGGSGSSLGCGDDYPLNSDSWMIYGPFSLSGATAADLAFQTWLSSENLYDYVCALASTDGSNFSGNCWYGNSSGWIAESLDLSNVPTNTDPINLLGQSNVWIAFYFYSDYSVVMAEGAYVDDIVLRKCTTATCSAGSPAALPNKNMHMKPFSTVLTK